MIAFLAQASASPIPAMALSQSIAEIPFTQGTFLSVLKFLFLCALAIYLVFGLVIIRQISLMNKTVESPISGFLTIMGYVHLLVSILVWLIAFVTL